MNDPEEYRITVGDIRKQLSDLDDDCAVHFSCETGELFNSQVKVRHRDSNDNPLVISYEFGGEDIFLKD